MSQTYPSPLHFVFNDFDDVTNPLLAAGQAYATLEVGKRLAQRGHRITVISSRFPGYQDRLENGIHYTHIGLGSQWVILNNLVYLAVLPFVTMRQSADIIIDCFTTPISTLCSSLFTSIPVVGLPTSFEAHAFSRKYHLPFWIVEKFGARTYRYFLPYTKHYAAKMKRYNPAIVQQVVPEGVGEEFFAVTKKTPKHVLYLGRFDIDQKGIDLLLAAWSKIHTKVPYPLVMAGKGSDQAKIEALIRKYNLDNSVKIVGPAYNDKKRQLLAEAVCVAFPSRHEGFSLFGLEALATATPLVAFDIPGLDWSFGPAVIKAPCYDIDAFAQLLLETTTASPTQQALLFSEARDLAKKYSWDSVVDKWLEFFTNIVLQTKLRVALTS